MKILQIQIRIQHFLEYEDEWKNNKTIINIIKKWNLPGKRKLHTKVILRN